MGLDMESSKKLYALTDGCGILEFKEMNDHELEMNNEILGWFKDLLAWWVPI